MKTFIPYLSLTLLIIIFSSCRNDNTSPIRNVRFDPGLLNPMQAAGGVPCTSHSYYYEGKSKALGTVYSGMILVSFAENLNPAQAEAVVESYGFVEKLGQAVRTNSAWLYPVQLVDGLSCRQVELAFEVMAKDPSVSYVAPYFEASKGSQLLGVSNEFIVTVENGRQPATEVLKRLAHATRTELVTSLGEDTFVLRADKNSRGNALEMANFFHEQPLIKLAEPDFVMSQAM